MKDIDHAAGASRTRLWYEVAAVLPVVLLPLWLFREHLAGQAVLVGNADRLNHFLPFIRFHSEALAGGSLPAWSPFAFGGLNTLGLHFSFTSPIYALLPPDRVTLAAGNFACLILVLAGLGAYWALRQFGASRFAAALAAPHYSASTLAVQKALQHDITSALLVMAPLLLVAVNHVRPGRLARQTALLLAGISFLLAFLFLQTASYLLLLLGAFTVYLGWRRRDWRPLAALAIAASAAFVVVSPRIVAIAEEMAGAVRGIPGRQTACFGDIERFQNIRPLEILRLFGDGIFGRLPSEAAALGNNMNLTEGMLLNSSVLAVFIVLAGTVAALCRRVHGRSEPAWPRAHVGFFASVVLFGLAYIGLWPVRWVIFQAYGGLDMTHARLLVAALFPAVLLVAWGIDSLWPRRRGEPAAGTTDRLETLTLLRGGAGAVVLVVAVVVAATWLVRPLDWFNPDGPDRSNLLGPPADPVRGAYAFVSEPGVEYLRWTVQVSDRSYVIELWDGAEYQAIGEVPAPTFSYSVSQLPMDGSGRLRLRVCALAGCGEVLPFERRGDLERPPRLVEGVYLHGPTVLAIGLLVLAGVTLAVAATVGRGRLARLAMVMLAVAAVLDAGRQADYRLNAPDNQWQGVAFPHGNMMKAPAGAFAAPSPDELEALQAALDVDNQRIVAICPADRFPTFCAAHLTHFYGLRMLDGYAAGVPAGLAHFPWPDGVESLRSLTFRRAEDLPWRLLGLLNVGAAVVVTPAFYMNDPDLAGGGGIGMPEILPNPEPVLPRVFLAGQVMPAETVAEAAAALMDTADPRRLSYVEGLEEGETLARGPTIDSVRFAADRVAVDLPAADGARFVVVNGNHHPAWRATVDGVPARVFRVNAAMRGVRVPPGGREVVFQLQPFLYRPASLWLVAGGLGLGLAGIVLAARADRRWTPRHD